MGKDTTLFIVIIAVVLGGAAAFFLFSADEDVGPDIETGGELAESDALDRGAVRREAGPRVDPTVRKKDPATTPKTPKVTAGPPSAIPGVNAAIIGRVIDPDGEAVPNAAVALCIDVSDHPTFSLQGDIVVQALSGEDGSFEIAEVDPEDRYVLRVEHEAFASEVVPQLDLDPGNSRRLDIQLREGMKLQGTVLDIEGRPLLGAEVLVFDQQTRSMDPERNVERVALTDDTGAFQFLSLNPGHKRVTARMTGMSTKTQNSVVLLPNKPVAPLEFKLGPGEVLAGMVVDQFGPVAGAMINAQPVRQGGRNVVTNNYPPTKSLEDGSFLLEGLAPGAYTLICHARGYPARGTRLTARTGEAEVTLNLIRNPVIRGRVFDEDTGDPIPRFTIIMGREEYLVHKSFRMSQRFDNEDGSFEFICDQDSGDYYFFATAPGFAAGRSTQITVMPNNDVESVDIAVYKGVTVKGEVTDSSGSPVVGASVELVPESPAMQGQDLGFIKGLISRAMKTVSHSARTDKDGRYAIENVQEGFFVVKASHGDFSGGEMEKAVQVPRQGETTFPKLELMRGGSLRGVVYGEEGDPEPAARVQLMPKGTLGGDANYSGVTNAEGVFKIDRIKPGIYIVEVVERKGEAIDPFTRLFSRQNSQQEVIIGDGDSIDIEID